PNDRERGVRVYSWGHDGESLLYLQDAGGDENWRLFAVNVATLAVRELTPFENVQAQVIDHNKHFPNEALIGLNREDARFHDVYHLDLKSGTLRMVAKNPGDVVGWVVDAEFKVRGATATTD